MLTIDRFEGEYALIKYKKRIFHIPKSLMPKGAREGDTIKIQITVEEGQAKKEKEAKI